MSPTAPTVARSESISADLRQVLRSLKLSAITDTLPERVALATGSHMAYQDFLAMILSDEVERRDRPGPRPGPAPPDWMSPWSSKPGTTPPSPSSTNSCGRN